MAFCADCKESGPQIRRPAGGALLMGAEWNAPSPVGEWASYLVRHEYHDLRLITTE